MYSTLPIFELAVLSGLLSICLVGVGYWRCSTQSRLLRYSFIGTAIAGVLWASGYAAYLAADPAYSYAALRVMWLGAIPYVTLWFVFILTYTGHDHLFTQSTLGLLAIEPVVILLAAVTTPAHSLFLGGSTTTTVGVFSVAVPVVGPLFVFHLVYLFLLGNIALLSLVRMLGGTDPAYHPQLLLLFVVGFIPLVGPIEQLFNAQWAAFGGTPLLLSLSAVLLVTAIARYRLFEMLPTARNQVLSTMEDGVVLVDDEGRVRIANTAARHQLSLPEPVIGRDAADVLPCGKELLQFSAGNGLPENTKAMAADSRAVPRPDGGNGQLRPHPSGVQLILDDAQYIVSTEPIPVETAVEGQLLVFRDITSQRDQELELQAVIEHTTDVVLIAEPTGQVSYVSPSVNSELAYSQLELVGRDVSELFHPDDTDSVADEIADVTDTDETINSQYRIRTGDSNWRMVETTVRGSRSTPTTDGVIITMRDITDRYRHQQRRRVMNRVLRHDLRNDMNVVVGHAEILVDTLENGSIRHAETIERKASNLVRLGEKVRKIDQRLHGQDRELKQIDLGRLVEEEVRSIHQSHPDSEIRTCIEEVAIWGDTLVRTAIKNIVENAVEHNNQPTPEVDVAVGYSAERDRVELTVSDNGPGVPEAEQRVITAGIETPLEHISGLGLWLVKWIVEGMDGELSIENKEPHGSIVTLSFPTVEAATKRSAEPTADSSGQFTGTVRSREESNPIQTTTRSTD